jgi:hypothetical protein
MGFSLSKRCDAALLCLAVLEHCLAASRLASQRFDKEK